MPAYDLYLAAAEDLLGFHNQTMSSVFTTFMMEGTENDEDVARAQKVLVELFFS